MPALLVAIALLIAVAPPLESRHERVAVVRGTVTSEFGQPLQGANVFSTELAASVGTDAAGRYVMHLSVAEGARFTIRVRSVGFQPQVRELTATADTLTADFVMRQGVVGVEEIVVTGVVEGQERAKVPFAVSRLGDGPPIMGRGAAAAIVGRDPHNTEEYAGIEDHRFLSVASAPLSTFSVDVDRASYSNVRRYIREGQLPPKDAVRIEELLNYFTYAYEAPGSEHPVTITTDVTAAPWRPRHRIVRIGLQTAPIATRDLPPSNLVFLIDVSGSMQSPNKLPLVKQAFRLLVQQLREQDRVALVVYAGQAGLVLPSTSAAHREEILGAIDRLEAGGSTAGGAGIRLAYDVAKQHHRRGGNNRVILATDGDFNVGISSTSELERFVEERRNEGTALTVLGFGMGNYKDNRLETLADKGNGNYAYVDDLAEARKVFVEEMGATLHTVAKDVKLQVEFNPATVQAYRLIGYENRALRNEDFTDDRKDAGDMGAGHSVTALYEIVPVGVTTDVRIGTTDSLRYQRPAVPQGTTRGGELLFVKVRYKAPNDSTSREMRHAARDVATPASADLRFTLAVAQYGMLLRDSEYKGESSWESVLTLARDAAGADKLRSDFVELVGRTQEIASRQAQR